MSMTPRRDDLDEPIQHDQLADEADLLTTAEANARVRELLRDTLRELAEREQSGASDLELTNLREKVVQLQDAVRRYR
jgi:hypothetical protein